MSTVMNPRWTGPTRLQEPQLRGDAITAERYVSREYFHDEWQRMWRRTWQIGGVAYQAPEPGDYLVSDLGPESILMVRQQDGRFRAYYNVCPHRGTRLLQGPDGHGERFTCAYHGWQFDYGGVVINVPNAADYRQGNPCGKLRLTEMRRGTLRLRLVQHGFWRAVAARRSRLQRRRGDRLVPHGAAWCAS